MIVNLVEFSEYWAAIEYTDLEGHVQRRWIPRTLAPSSSKGTARVPDEVVNAGLEYSDVDLPASLGSELPAIRTADLQDQLRRAGVWTRQDYRSKAQVVAGVLQRLRGADVASVTNAALLGG